MKWLTIWSCFWGKFWQFYSGHTQDIHHENNADEDLYHEDDIAIGSVRHHFPHVFHCAC